MIPEQPRSFGRYARAMRRRWRLLVALPVLAVVVALASIVLAGPPPRPPEERVRPTWTATTVLLRGDSLDVDLTTVAALATLGDVPTRAAERVDLPRDELLGAVTVTVGGETTADGGAQGADGAARSSSGTTGEAQRAPTAGRASSSDLLVVTATGDGEESAEDVATALAAELIAWTQETATTDASAEAERRAAEIERLRAELEEMEATTEVEPVEAPPDEPGTRAGGAPPATTDRTARTGGTAADTAYDVKLQEYARLLGEQEAAANATAPPPGLTVLEPAVAVRDQVREPAESLLPSGRRARVLGALVVGVVGAVGLVLLLDRLDGRVYSVAQVRRHLPQRVIAAVPAVRRRERRRGGATDRATESVRMLAAKLVLPVRAGRSGARTILLVGPRHGSGVTFVAHRLAGELATLGSRTLVLDCDLRGDTGRPPPASDGPDLAGLLEAPPNGQAVLEGVVGPPHVDGPVVLPSGAAANPAGLLGSDRMARVLREARDRVEMVLVDAPPLLEVSDAAPLVPMVDLVLLVLRAGRTTVAEASEVAELVVALGARDVAVVLDGAEDAGPTSSPFVPWTARRSRVRHGGNPPLVSHSSEA